MGKMYYEAGDRIRKLREEKYYSRKVLADKADISPKFLYEIENGMKGFSAETLYKLAKSLGVSADYILSGKNEKELENLNQFLKEFDERDKDNLLLILKTVYQIAH